jgi:large subunit ribosomal protein L19
MSTIIESIERRALRRVPQFAAGDRVRVHFQVVEGTRRRTQVFEGIVISRSGSGARETFIVRKQSFGVGVERTFPLHSPKIERLEVVARGAVRRAKLYYLRGRVGKRARVAERRWGIEDDVVIAEPEEGPLDSEGVAQEEAEVEVVEPEAEESESEAADEPESEAADEPEAETSEDPKADASKEPEAEATEEPAAETAADENAEGDADEGEEPAAAEADEAGA